MKSHEQSFTTTSVSGLRLRMTNILRYTHTKRSLLFLIVLISLASCDVYYLDTERPYSSRDLIIGSHYAQEYSQTYHEYYEYNVWIAAGNRSNEIYIGNLYLDGLSVYARVSYDAITIPFQVIDGYEIEGAGTIYGDRIDLNYYVRDQYENTIKDFCETTLWNDNYAGRKAENKRNSRRVKDIIY